MRIIVEQWAPEYGSSTSDTMDETTATVDVEVEVPVEEWAPRTPPPGTHQPPELAFVDGVRRVEPGPASGDALSLALQGCMADLERVVSEAVPDDCLLVLDGPIRERTGLDHAVGYVKTHHVSYLPATIQEVVAQLQPGERTPVFLIGDGGFRRWSWYVRLPGDTSHAWAGVVRCELSPDRVADDVFAIADTCALMLPRFGSEAHKDKRAPQNLYPIAGLERELRRRLGDPALLYRALRAAA